MSRSAPHNASWKLLLCTLLFFSAADAVKRTATGLELPSDVEDDFFDNGEQTNDANTDAELFLPSDPGEDSQSEHEEEHGAKRKRGSKKCKQKRKAAAKKKPVVRIAGPDRKELMQDPVLAKRVPELWYQKVPAHLQGALQDDFMEIYTKPRMIPFAQRAGMRGNLSADISTGFNLKTHDARTDLVIQVKARRPKVIMCSPPCTMMSGLQNLNWSKMDRFKREDLFREALLHLNFVMFIADLQIQSGRCFIHEHPDSAISWDEQGVQQISRTPGAQIARLCMCRYGLVTKEKGTPVLKKTKLLSNIPAVHDRFHNQMCPGHDVHQILQGTEGGIARSLWAQIYPDDFCKNMIEAIEEHLANL